MKEALHPKYQVITVTCVCGAEFELGTTAEKMHVEICSSCHPFYAGTNKVVDTEGRIDKFKKKFGKKK